MRRHDPKTEAELVAELQRLAAAAPELVIRETGRRMMLEREKGALRGVILASLCVIVVDWTGGDVTARTGFGMIFGGLALYLGYLALERFAESGRP